jgi:hypothetical protein
MAAQIATTSAPSAVDIRDVHDRLRRDQVQVFQDLAFVLVEVERAYRVAVREMVADLPDCVADVDVFLFRRLGVLLGLEQLLLDRLEVREREFRVDRLDVVDRVDPARDMRHVVIFETAHDVCDRIGFADVREELVAEPLALRRARHQPRDVDELHGCRNHLRRFHDAGQYVESRIRHRHDADVRVDGAEGIVLRRDLGRGQRIE